MISCIRVLPPSSIRCFAHSVSRCHWRLWCWEIQSDRSVTLSLLVLRSVSFSVTQSSFPRFRLVIGSYTKDTFREETKTTIGVEFGHKTIRIEDRVIKAQIWDTGLPSSLFLSASNRASWSGAFQGSHPRLLSRCIGSLVDLFHYVSPIL